MLNPLEQAEERGLGYKPWCLCFPKQTACFFETVLRPTEANMSDILVSEMDSHTLDTGPGTVTELQQLVSVPPAESMEVLDNPTQGALLK